MTWLNVILPQDHLSLFIFLCWDWKLPLFQENFTPSYQRLFFHYLSFSNSIYFPLMTPRFFRDTLSDLIFCTKFPSNERRWFKSWASSTNVWVRGFHWTRTLSAKNHLWMSTFRRSTGQRKENGLRDNLKVINYNRNDLQSFSILWQRGYLSWVGWSSIHTYLVEWEIGGIIKNY